MSRALTCPPTGLYGAEGILPARRTLRPQGKGRWQQLWETPTLLWEAPQLGLDTSQGLELLSLLGALLALGALLLRRLRNLSVYLLLWAAYLSVCQASGGCLLPPLHHWDPCHQLSPVLPTLRLPLSLPCLPPQTHTPCSLTTLLPAGGPGVSLFPVVSDFWVRGCSRWGGGMCLPLQGGPSEGNSLDGGGPLCSSFSP